MPRQQCVGSLTRSPRSPNRRRLCCAAALPTGLNTTSAPPPRPSESQVAKSASKRPRSRYGAVNDLKALHSRDGAALEQERLLKSRRRSAVYKRSRRDHARLGCARHPALSRHLAKHPWRCSRSARSLNSDELNYSLTAALVVQMWCIPNDRAANDPKSAS